MTIRGQNIVCLVSQDYDDLWTRKHRWMTRLAEHNRIFWVNTQMHAVTYVRKLPQTWRRIFPGPPRQVSEQMWVYTPPVTVPFYQMSPAICRMHNIVLNRFLRHHLSRLGFDRNILWLYTPYNNYQIGRLFDYRRVYECVDDFSAARGLIFPKVVDILESETVKNVDLAVVTAYHLAKKFKKNSASLLVSPNAVDFDHFAKVSDDSTPIDEELREIDGPVIGFLGSIAYWVDLELIAELARKRPDWAFVLVGPVCTGIGALAGLPNVRIIGRRPYEKLPRYLKRFDVCLNPYKNDGVAESASPLKLYEYLASGKPVVSSDMPEARRFSPVVAIARNIDEYVAKIDNALRGHDENRRRQQLEIARQNSWTDRFAEVENHVESIIRLPVDGRTTSDRHQELRAAPIPEVQRKTSMSGRRQPIIAINTLSVPDADLGGGYTYLYNLLPHLIENAPGARFHLLVTETNRRFFDSGNDRVHLTTLSNLSLRSSVRTFIDRFWVRAWLRKIEADLYFVPYGWLPKDSPCPTVWTFQNLFLLEAHCDKWTIPIHLHRRVRDRLRWWTISRRLMPATVDADRIIAVSETAKRELVAQYPLCDNRVTVIHEGVSNQFVASDNQNADRQVLRRLGVAQPFYLSVSTLMRHKNFACLIRAFAEFKRQTGAPGMLVIAGGDWGGHRGRLEQTVREVAAERFVRFLGHVQSVDLPALYRNARVFLLLSNCEAFGLPALEAMACGCPTVVADSSGLAEIVGHSGIQVNPKNQNELVDTLRHLDRSTEQRSSLSQAAVVRAAQFSWHRSAQRTVAVFESLLGRQISAAQQSNETATPTTSENAANRLPVGVD